jgi:hypothetical protein
LVRGFLFALAGLIGHAQATVQDRTLAQFDFTASPQEWGISGDTGAVAPVFQPSGGGPGGYISHVDEAVGETWYFRAPDSVLRQLAAAENGTLSYSLKQSSDDTGFLDDDVIIAGPAGRLSYRFGTSPSTAWTPFSVKLTAAAGWRWNWNARATQEQIHRVLANATSLEIRGEYYTGPDEGGLDTVVLRSGGRAGK